MPSEHPIAPVGGRLALVLTAEAGSPSSLARLSDTERRIYDARPLAERRRRFLAGRALGKLLVLELLEGRPHDALSGPRRPGEADWRRFDDRTFRALEILPRSGLGSPGRPVLHDRRGRVLRWSLSISHAAGWTAVALSGRGPCGVDLEEVVPRHPAFYRDSFTAGERAWAAGSERGNDHRAWTLLWTLKEAVLKSGAVDASLWDLPRLELRCASRPRLDALGCFDRCRRFDAQAIFDRRALCPLNLSVSAGHAAAWPGRAVILSSVSSTWRELCLSR